MATTKQAKNPAVKKTVANKVTAKSSTTKVEATVNNAIGDVKQEATSILETLQANLAKSQENAQQAWFAGLGVFGRSADEIKVRYEQMVEDRQQLVNDLIARGEKVQDQASVALKDRRADIKEQIEAVKGRITDLTSGFDVAARLQDISDKLGAFGKGLKKSA